MKPWRRWIVWLTLITMMAVVRPLTVKAASETPFQEVTVDLWPEYDRASMLVILHIQLPASVTLPAQVTVRIPARAGDPNAVAVVGSDGRLLVAPYKRTVEGEWATLEITANSPGLQVEYYDTLERDGARRRYVYRWPGDHAVEHLTLHIQQPVGAEDFTLTPAAGTPVREEDGLLYYTSDLGRLSVGESFTLEIDYAKKDDTLTVQQLSAQPSAPLENVEGQLSLSDWLPWGLGGLGLALILGGLVWYWRSGRSEAVPQASERRRKHRPRRQSKAETVEVRYCPQCGTRAQPGDRFCRNCGAPLR